MQLIDAISSFGDFCELLGLGKVKNYLVSRQVHQIQDWGLYRLDDEGQAIQKELDDRVKVKRTHIRGTITKTLSRHCLYGSQSLFSVAQRRKLRRDRWLTVCLASYGEKV